MALVVLIEVNLASLKLILIFLNTIFVVVVVLIAILLKIQ